MNDPKEQMFSIKSAAAAGISRLRKPVWAIPQDHLMIDIIDGEPGPWTHLYSPCNLMIAGRDPQDVLCLAMDYDAEEFVPYTGPLPDSDAYKKDASRFGGTL